MSELTEEEIDQLATFTDEAQEQRTRFLEERNAELQEQVDSLEEEGRRKDGIDYQARVWRTEHLVRCAKDDLCRIFYGLVGDHKVRIEHGEFPVDGFPYCSPNKVRLRFSGKVADGENLGAAYARAVARLLETAWYPLT